MSEARVVFVGSASSVERAANEAVAAVGRVERSAHSSGKAFRSSGKDVEHFGGQIKHLAGLTIGTLGAVELVHGIKESINAAGDLEKQQAKVIHVFGQTPKVLEAFEKSSAKAYGVSHLAALTAAASTGALLKNLGIGGNVAAGMSVGILKLSSDMASFNNLPTAVVAERVNKALLGQTRGLKSLGISLSATDVNAKAFALGLVRPIKSADGLRAATDRVTVAEHKWVDAVKAHGRESDKAKSAESALIAARKAQATATLGVVPPLTAAQRATATYALILERSKVQQGDFGRNSDTLANKTKVLDAEFSNLTDRVGEALVPAMKVLVDLMAGPGIAAAGSFLTTVGDNAKSLWKDIQPLAPAAHAAAGGLKAIAGVQGVIPTIVATTVAYKGLTLALEGGAAAKAGAMAFLGGLTSPFARSAAGAKAAATEMRAAAIASTVFGDAAVAADAEMAAANATTGASFLGLTNPIMAIATVGAIAVGALVLLSSTSESAGEKARKARDDFLGLADAINHVKDTKLDVKQSRLDVAGDRSAIAKFSPTLIAARAGAHQAFPDTAKGARDEQAAQQRLGDAVLHNSQLYVNLARDKGRLVQATTASSKATADEKKAADDNANAWDGVRKKMVDVAELQGPKGLRGGHVEAVLANQAKGAHLYADALRATTTATKGLDASTRTNARSVANFIDQAGKVPDKKIMNLLLRDAATKPVQAFKRELDALRDKTVTVTGRVVENVTRQLAHPFTPRNPVTGKAEGGVIDRPMLAVIGEEAPRYPEFIIPTNPARRERALGLIEQMRDWVPGFAPGGGPKQTPLATRESQLLRGSGTTGTTTGTHSSTKNSKPKTPSKPKWLLDFEANGLPGDSAFNNAIGRATADLADAGRTAARADDIRATHRLIKLSAKRLSALHGAGYRGAHTDSGVWQAAVNAEIASVGGTSAGYYSSLSDLVKKKSPDEITVAIPSDISWGIEQAGFSDSLGDDVKAQTRKQAWLKAQLNATTGTGKKKRLKLALGSAKREAFKRELARTGHELDALGVSQGQLDDAASQQATSDAAQKLADAGVPPDLPIEVQQALADAALTEDKGDDLAALQLEERTIAGQLAAATDPRVQVALKGDLAGVRDQIKSLTNAGDASGSGVLSDGSLTPQQQAVNDQLQARLDVATRTASLSEAELKALTGPGDIGTGNYGSALMGGAGTPAILTVLGDQRSLSTLAGAFVQGVSSQPAVAATRQSIVS